MQIIVTGRHVEVTDAMKQYARDKLSRITRERPRINEMHVIMDVEKYRHRVEISARGKSLELFCSEETADMYASIDGALAKLERQIRRYRERRGRRHKPFGAPEDGGRVGEESPHIAARLAMKIMYPGEALLQMKVAPHLFFVFLNAETGMVNLLYRTDENEVAFLSPRKFKRAGKSVRYQRRVFSEDSISPASRYRAIRKGSRLVEWASPEEALASMVEAGQRFRFFLSSSAQNASLIYRRADGAHVLIEPRE